MNFKIMTATCALSALLLAGPALGAHHEKNEYGAAYYAEMLYTDARSEDDQARDQGRKPAEVLALIGVKSGQMVIDIGTGGGYYAENLARAAAGNGGMVHAVNNPGTVERFPQVIDALAGRREGLTSGTIIPEVTEFADMAFHAPVDVAFMGQFYHEVIRQNMDAKAINAAVFNALKPGGVYVIEIHNAAPGAGRDVSEAFHRADPDIVRAEVLAAGFELAVENTELFGNPDDPLNIMVFDESIRGKTSRTLFIFRKPE
ncbi:MAG: hypothetical protein V3R20_02755 [Sphingomonadales bacterium]